MAYININNPANYQLQEFGQMGFRVIDSDHLNVDGETYRTIYVVQDAVVTALTAKGDDITSKALLAGTLLHGLFSDVSVTSGKVLVYMAGRLSASEILALYNAYLIAEGAVIEGSDCVESELNSLTTDTYADASLVLIPSGYDTGVVYGERPLDSRSQLDFTRASNATRVKSNGLVEKVRTNLLLQSNTFSDAAWSKTTTSVTSGQSGYDGSSDAWLLTATTNLNAYMQKTGSFSGVNTFSIYAKANTSSFFVLFDSANPYVYFDLGNGTIGTQISNPINSSITNVGNGWYRCSITTNNPNNLRIYVVDANGSTAVTNGNSIYIQDAQLEVGDIATDYIPTTTSARSTFAGITVDGTSVPNVPRLDYSGGASCPSLLLEPQRSNVIPNSEYLKGSNWNLGSIIINDNADVSPEGLQNASLMYPVSTGTFRRLADFTTTIGATDTFSFYAKASGFRYISTPNLVGSISSVGVTFDLQDGEVIYTKTGEGITAEMEDAGNGWYRCIVKSDGTGTQKAYLFLSDASNLIIATPNGTDGVLLYGLQIEAGSYPTSYIPTYGTSVTRIADACSKTGISSLIGQSEGVIYWEFNVPAEVLNNTAYYLEISVNDGTSSNKLALNYYNTGRIQFVAFVGGSLVVNINLNSYGLTAGNHKFALAYKLNDYVAYVDGVSVGTDTSASVPATSKLELYDTSGGVNVIKQALVFKTRLSNDKLAALTTL